MSRRTSNNQHTVDIFFVLTLFCVFAVCASLLIALGANVYQSTITDMNRHYTLSTAAEFITEKIHQHDMADCISVSDINGTDMLVLKETYGENVYYDYIYMYDGYIRELFTADSSPASPEAGQKILKVNKFSLKKASDNTISLAILDDNGNLISRKIYYHSVSN